MIVLDATTKSLEVILAGAVTTNQLPIVASYVDVTTTAYTPKANDTATNNTTAVTPVAAPAASTQRQVKLVTVYNADTVAAAVTVRLNNSGTFRTLHKATLAVGSALVYTDGEGFRVIDASGNMLTSSGGGSGSGLLASYAHVWKNATQSLTNAAFTVLTFDSEDFDTDAFHSTVTNTSRLTVPATGKYLVYGQCNFNPNATGARGLWVTVNGDTSVGASSLGAFVFGPNVGATFGTFPEIILVMSLTAADYVELQAYQDSGGALTSGSATARSQANFFGIMRIG